MHRGRSTCRRPRVGNSPLAGELPGQFWSDDAACGNFCWTGYPGPKIPVMLTEPLSAWLRDTCLALFVIAGPILLHIHLADEVWAQSDQPQATQITQPLVATRDDDTAQEQLRSTSDWQRNEGFYTYYWDDQEGKIWLEIDHFEEPFLYVSSLASGLGSNPIGLDRGQIGSTRIVHWKRVGKRVFLVEPNLRYRGLTDNAAERAAIRDSFASSIIWAADLEEASEGGYVVDLTDFLLRDAHDCVATLKQSGQGNYTLDRGRSYIHQPRTMAFPQNTEFEALLTFQADAPGRLVRQTAADGQAVSLRQHHSFVQLPDDNYQPRQWDPRCGCFNVVYADYSSPIDQPLERRWITRHRLQALDPTAEKSRVKDPIVYYLDPGVPEPVKSALLEGARWWNEAFEAAGYIDAFQVRVLPPEVDPMDVRYNVIQWVHRSTRGWSYGQSVIDPRTGEIIKGHVLLGSLRVRQDRLLIDGLAAGGRGADAQLAEIGQHAVNAVCECGLAAHGPNALTLASTKDSSNSMQVALSRIRQLSAHEVGHTLGFAHNFAASTYADRASVMDYPAPRIKIRDGQLDFSDAYAVGIGQWDKVTVRYAYSHVESEEQYSAPGQLPDQLQQILDSAIAEGMLYITDADARPAGAAHPLANLWDNGRNPVEALHHALAVREIGLQDFSASVLAPGEPLSELEKYFVPLYLHHRYQVEAAAKVLGGYEYSYALPGDGQKRLEPVAVEQQQAALDALLKTLQPSVLEIPQRIVRLLLPSAVSSPTDRERFSTRTSPLFDPGEAMRAAADATLGSILQSQRASRLADWPEKNWGLLRILNRLEESLLPHKERGQVSVSEAERIVREVYIQRLMTLAESEAASEVARAIASQALESAYRQLSRLIEKQEPMESPSRIAAHYRGLAKKIERFLDRPYPQAMKPEAPELPPGSPIGLR